MQISSCQFRSTTRSTVLQINILHLPCFALKTCTLFRSVIPQIHHGKKCTSCRNLFGTWSAIIHIIRALTVFVYLNEFCYNQESISIKINNWYLDLLITWNNSCSLTGTGRSTTNVLYLHIYRDPKLHLLVYSLVSTTLPSCFCFFFTCNFWVIVQRTHQ